ncbi:hypothetical protein Q7O_002960 [Pectobacterium carotovorum subsp. carotovorum PCCS1]|nr:hypothetical protein [Pectobacterium carotovorum subsp. carotovorum PCCS1]
MVFINVLFYQVNVRIGCVLKRGNMAETLTVRYSRYFHRQ